MTLMEVLVALSISSVAILLIVAATDAVLTSRTRASGALDAVLTAALARQVVVDVISGSIASPESGYRFYALNQSVEGMDNDAVAFVTRHSPTRESAVSRGFIFIDRDSMTLERGLVLSARSSGDPIVIELVPAATSLSVSYFSNGRWQEDWPSPTTLPEALLLRIGGSQDSLPRLMSVPIIVLTNGGA